MKRVVCTSTIKIIIRKEVIFQPLMPGSRSGESERCEVLCTSRACEWRCQPYIRAAALTQSVVQLTHCRSQTGRAWLVCATTANDSAVSLLLLMADGHLSLEVVTQALSNGLSRGVARHACNHHVLGGHSKRPWFKQLSFSFSTVVVATQAAHINRCQPARLTQANSHRKQTVSLRSMPSAVSPQVAAGFAIDLISFTSFRLAGWHNARSDSSNAQSLATSAAR